MWLYLIIFAIPLFAYLKGPAVNRNKKFLAYYLGALALFVGLSDMFGGYDRFIYGEVFDNIANGVTKGFGYKSIIVLTYFEPAFSALGYLIALITENRYIYILLITLLIYFCLYKAFEKYMPNYPLAIMIFLGMAFFFTFTYLRQVLAFTVAWFGVKYLIERKVWKFLAVVVLVAMLHKSGIVFAILYILPLKKIKPAIVIVTLMLCAAAGLSGVTGALYDAYADTTTMHLNSYNTDSNARVAYFIEVVFFTWIILSNYKSIEPTRRNIAYLNMAWTFCAILLLFMRSGDGGRVAWFFILGIIYTVSLISTSEQNHRKIKNGIGSLMIVVMLGLYLRVYQAWQNGYYLYPYKTFLTNGQRPEYTTGARFEYDQNYNRDKFYRPAFRFLKK